MSKASAILLITSGEGAGIGPDLVAKLADSTFTKLRSRHIIPWVVGDPCRMADALSQAGLDPANILVEANTPKKAKALLSRSLSEPLVSLCPLPTATPIIPGQEEPRNRTQVLTQLDQAVQYCLKGEVQALCTLPVHKQLLHTKKSPFWGHTEFFQKACGGLPVVMSFETPSYIVALATTHLPLRQVADAITLPRLIALAKALHETHPNRTLYFLGLNPHAGEGGVLGDEETYIYPALLKELGKLGIKAKGPLVADGFFHDIEKPEEALVVAMYHDQILPWLKAVHGSHTAHVTLGLPFFRSSPAHGTALALAAKLASKTDKLSYAVLQSDSFHTALMAAASYIERNYLNQATGSGNTSSKP